MKFTEGYSSPPLVVDLDGTLICTDMLHESVLRLMRDKPLGIFFIPFWLLKGKAVLKKNLANATEFDPNLLPYKEDFFHWLKQQHDEGRELILCTASDQCIANSISDHLGIFDKVIASDGVKNLLGKNKAEVLINRFGLNGFDYAGNSTADLEIWKHSRQAVLVNTSKKLTKKVQANYIVSNEFPAVSVSFKDTIKVLRIHQWMKNLLLFVPLLAAHQFTDVGALMVILFAFFSFSLCASSVYIINDLLDLESDRLHLRKRKRPFASGLVPISKGVVLVPLLLLSSLLLANNVTGQLFLAWLLFYFVLTCTYSWYLKRLMFLDCLTLATLYTLRIIAGAAAIDIQLSFWMLSFAVFLFLSLAFVKRYAELEIQLTTGKQKVHGRGYYTSDAPLLQSMGISSGYVSVLVMALYLSGDDVIRLYESPQIIWASIPVMLFWINWMWMQAHRGKMHDDPLVFAVKDKASIFSGIIFAGILIFAMLGWS